jgi:hypothetical protein
MDCWALLPPPGPAGQNFLDPTQKGRVARQVPNLEAVLSISENFVSIFALGPISDITARAIARALPGRAGNGRGLPSTASPRPPQALRLPVLANDLGQAAKLRRMLAGLGPGGAESLVLFRCALYARRPAGQAQVTLTFTRAGDGLLGVDLTSASDERTVRTRVQHDVILLLLLDRLLGPPGEGEGTDPPRVVVTVPPYGANGELTRRTVGNVRVE